MQTSSQKLLDGILSISVYSPADGLWIAYKLLLSLPNRQLTRQLQAAIGNWSVSWKQNRFHLLLPNKSVLFKWCVYRFWLIWMLFDEHWGLESFGANKSFRKELLNHFLETFHLKMVPLHFLLDRLLNQRSTPELFTGWINRSQPASSFRFEQISPLPGFLKKPSKSSSRFKKSPSRHLPDFQPAITALSYHMSRWKTACQIAMISFPDASSSKNFLNFVA